MPKQGKHKRVIKIAGLCVVGLMLLFSLISIIVVKVTYDGQFPRFERHDETVTAALRYADIETEYPRQMVNFKSGNNLLQGYIYGLDQDRGLVVVAHGLGGGADSYLPQIQYFVDQGWRVFAYDATGSFDSEGDSTKGFPQSLLDLDAALNYINTQPEVVDLPVLLFGHSWGGYAVANILHYDHDIASVVTVSAPNSSMEMLMEQGRRMMGGFACTQYPYLWLYQRMLFGEAASLNAVDAINGSDVPVLIIHGTEDHTFEYGGSAIIAKLDVITNPNVRAISVDEPGRNGHADLFRSSEAIAYIEEINTVYRELFERYEQNIPYEVRQVFYEEVDRALVNDLNRELMDDIQAFFVECLGEQH